MQRVAIGRALVRSPAVYLMDEPLSSLDAKLRSEMRIELQRIQRELGATVLYVTHDQTEAMTLATRIGVMDRGNLVQVGTPREIYENPVAIEVTRPLFFDAAGRRVGVDTTANHVPLPRQGERLGEGA